MRASNRLLLLATALCCALLPVAARATLQLPGGDALLNGAFDDLRYGATGTSYVTPLLYVGDLGATDSPSQQAAVTDLDYQYLLAGLGTPAASILYSITNTGIDPFTDLRFVLNVQADGSASFADLVTVAFGAGSPGEPDSYQVGDFAVDPLAGLIAANDGTDGSDACGAPACDADLALQWDLPTLAPGLTWTIRVSLSDDGSVLSTRNLQATSADTDATVLMFSGFAQVVPEPGTALLIGLGLCALRAGRRAGATA
jgi:hypothetical protein